MPLLLSTHPFPDTTLGLWQVAEAEAFFESDLPMIEAERQELNGLQNIRRLEWLSSRWLLHRVTGAPQRLPLAKDAFSKPFFLDLPDLYCSLSHSQGIVGALTATQNCGCDIQVLVDKMPRIAHKFLGKQEAEFISNFSDAQQFELFHLYWTAKESLYKSYGIKALDFREHIFVNQVNWDGYQGNAVGVVAKQEFRQEYQLRFGKVETETSSLVWAVCL